jgi:vacuolar-type H+-ATPase subunit I/STV1
MQQTEEPRQYAMPPPTGTFGYSKYLYSIAQGLRTAYNLLAGDVFINYQNIVEADTRLTAQVDELSTQIADLETTTNNTLLTSVSTINSQIDALNQWKDQNTDEIATEVDKAINSKVNQTAYDAVVSQLQDSDSTILTSLNQAIVDRQNADAVHSEKLAKVEAMFEALLTTYHLEKNGSVISSLDDIVIEAAAPSGGAEQTSGGDQTVVEPDAGLAPEDDNLPFPTEPTPNP